MEYERLTDKFNGEYGLGCTRCNQSMQNDNDYTCNGDMLECIEKATKRLGELEEKIENGELVETKNVIWESALELYREVKEMVLKDVRAEIVNEMVEKLLPKYKVLCVDEGDWGNQINQIAKEVIK